MKFFLLNYLKILTRLVFNRRHRVLDNNDDDVLSSQHSVDPVGDNTDKGEASLASLYNEVNGGSSATEENKINGILQGLLTCDSVELEGYEAMNLMEKSVPAHEIDHIPTRNYPSTNMINQEVNILSPTKPSDELSPLIIKGVIAASETNTILETTENSKEDNSSSRKSSDIVAVSETSLSDDPDRNCTSTHHKSMVDNSREPGFNANVDSNELHVDMDVDMGKGVMDDAVGRQNVEPNEPRQFQDKMLAENVQSVPTNCEANSAAKRSRRSDYGPEQCLQEKRDGSVAPANRQKRVKCAPKEFEAKRLQQRMSVAGAGTSGVRRSPRVSTKPLEFWKGVVYDQEKRDGSVAHANRQKRVKCAPKESEAKRLQQRMSVAGAGTSWCTFNSLLPISRCHRTISLFLLHVITH